MLEKDVNRILTSSLNKHGWAYKIPDPPQATTMMASPRPFDIIAVKDGLSYYIESKLIKSKYGAFNFKQIRDHQIYNLNRIKTAKKDAQTLIAVFYWVPRQIFDVLFFDIDFINQKIEDGIGSLKKKDILEFIAQDQYLTVKKREIDLRRLGHVIIRA